MWKAYYHTYDFSQIMFLGLEINFEIYLMPQNKFQYLWNVFRYSIIFIIIYLVSHWKRFSLTTFREKLVWMEWKDLLDPMDLEWVLYDLLMSSCDRHLGLYLRLARPYCCFVLFSRVCSFDVAVLWFHFDHTFSRYIFFIHSTEKST